MTIINEVDAQIFSFNGVEYYKNFTPVVVGNKIRILNTYDSSIELTSYPTLFSDFEVDGVVYASVALLQSALLPVIYTRDSLSGVSVSLLRQQFTFSGSQTFTLSSDYAQVYSVEVQGQGALSTSQYTLVAPNQITILDTLDTGDYIVVIYSNAIAGVQPYYSQAETDGLLDLKFDNPTGTGTQYLDGEGVPKDFDAVELAIDTTAITSGTDGRILFQKANKVSQNANLFWDDTNSRLGIGTATPTAPLHVVYSDNAFKTGIHVKNTNTNTQALCGYKIENSSGVEVGQFVYVPTNYVTTALQNTVLFSTLSNQKLGFVQNAQGVGGNDNDMYFSIGSTRIMTFNGSTKDIGINTTTPTSKLHIKAKDATTTPVFQIENSAGGTFSFRVKGNGVVTMANLPTSTTGLTAGDIWNDAGTLKIV